ncbi:MAG TPA: hypothetical protein VFU93_01640 [Acidimicrobiales bacterium]|nr:hypothetical protein [Acidimicrobiales bacterium]
MIIRGVSVFESIVYHSYVVDPANPCRPTLELEAVVRDGDVDAGPLMVSLAEYATLAGGPDVVRPCLDRLRERGRIVDHLGVPYVTFPTWTPIDVEHR